MDSCEWCQSGQDLDERFRKKERKKSQPFSFMHSWDELQCLGWEFLFTPVCFRAEHSTWTTGCFSSLALNCIRKSTVLSLYLERCPEQKCQHRWENRSSGGCLDPTQVVSEQPLCTHHTWVPIFTNTWWSDAGTGWFFMRLGDIIGFAKHSLLFWVFKTVLEMNLQLWKFLNDHQSCTVVVE